MVCNLTQQKPALEKQSYMQWLLSTYPYKEMWMGSIKSQRNWLILWRVCKSNQELGMRIN